MARPITSLDHYDPARASPEEAEAYRVAHEALYSRMNRMLQQADCQRRMCSPVTDAFGRPLAHDGLGR